MNLKNFLILVAFLSSVACETWKPRDYGVVFKYHPKVTGGVHFGVMTHRFTELTEAEVQEILKTAVILPATSWEMLAVDLVKACRLLGKKCDSEVSIIGSMLVELKAINGSLERGSK